MPNNKYEGVVEIDSGTTNSVVAVCKDILEEKLLAIKIKESEIDMNVFTLSILSTEEDENKIDIVQNQIYNSIEEVVGRHITIIPEMLNNTKYFKDIESDILYGKSNVDYLIKECVN